MPDPTRLPDLPTPALLLDLEVLEANLAGMQERADRLGVALRPHAKTHKCLEVARRQRELGARGLTVSTLAEARFFAAGGFTDLTWAFPLVLSRVREAVELAAQLAGRGGALRLLVDSEEAVVALREAARPGRPLQVFLKVDCGYGRAGVDPASERAVTLARSLAETPALAFDGLLSHSGHAYRATGRDGARLVAEEERRVMVELADRLRGEGLEVPAVSVGSTPAMAAAEDLTGVTEARPGNYCFYDATQAALGSCSPADCAVTVLAGVVSHRPGSGESVTDAGALALSKDPGADHLPGGWPWGMGAVFEDLAAYRAGTPSREVRLTALSQEHGKLSAPRPVGSTVRVLPNHSCLAVPNFPHYWLVRGEEVVGRWEILGRRE